MRWITAISIAYVRGLGEFGIGTDASDTLLCAAVYLGMFENRQMNASKPGDYVGLPRSTMDLEAFERVGRVERRGTTWRNSTTRSTIYTDHQIDRPM
jgi:hypothetical protein